MSQTIEIADAAPAVSGPEFLTVAEARARLRIGKSLALRLLAEGKIPSVKLGRRRLIPAHALHALAQQAA
ncbi:excisionase family DNA-binding protein [Roseomonas sp. CAU 1739]|uniref:excisionase family DNA-binding protein n=1 Tax=Roseomonas sp. CAU 1739 TaxID=3140364 RepID=UPI00325B3367